MYKNTVLHNLHIKVCFDQQENPSKGIQVTLLLIICDLGWLMLFCVIYRTQISRSHLKRQLLATLSLIIKKKGRKERIKQGSKHFCKHSPGSLGEFP